MNNFSRFQMNAYLWGNYVTRRNKYRWRYKRAYTRAYSEPRPRCERENARGFRAERERGTLACARALAICFH